MKDVIQLIEEGKIKRYFRARQKFSFKGAIAHITQRATGKEPLFIEDSDYLYALYLMKEKKNKFKFDILSFVLMPNHIHLLLRLSIENLSTAMKNLFETYAIYFNKKYNRKGHLFCGAYRSALCFDEGYILGASLYIHNNPVKAKLVENPIDYRWSSCALFLKEVEKKTFIDYNFILEMLDKDISKARVRYKELLEQLNFSNVNDVLEEPKGLDYLVAILRKRLPELYKREDDRNWMREHGLLGDVDLDEKIEELKQKGRLRAISERSARKFLIEQLKARGFGVSEIAEKLGVSRQTVYASLT